MFPLICMHKCDGSDSQHIGTLSIHGCGSMHGGLAVRRSLAKWAQGVPAGAQAAGLKFVPDVWLRRHASWRARTFVLHVLDSQMYT